MGAFYSVQEIDHTKKAYGFIPDHYSINDKKLKISGSDTKHIKRNCDLSQKFPKAYNQEGYHSSTANAVASIIMYLFRKYSSEHESKIKNVSRMWLHNLGRSELTKNEPVSIRTILKQMNKYGIVDEKDFPYKRSFQIPPKHIKSYYKGHFKLRKLNKDINNVKTCLSVLKLPIIFGFSVYESFHDKIKWDNDGLMPIPKSGEKQVGLQTVVAVGYSHKRKAILIRNSWGEHWKNDGYFFMPFEYFSTRNCDNCWVIDLEFDYEEEFIPISGSESESDLKSKDRRRRRRRRQKRKLKIKSGYQDSSDDDDEEKIEKVPKEIVIDLSDKCHIK